MSDAVTERERYALLRWFARDVAVGPRAVCYRCVTTDQFTSASVVRSDGHDRTVVAGAEDGPPLETVRSGVETALQEEAVHLIGGSGPPVAVVPLTETGDGLVLVLETDWQGGVHERDRAFLTELGRAASAAFERDVRRLGRGSVDATPADERPDGVPIGALADAEGRRKLEALQVTAESLVRARSKPEIARVAVETARDVLDCPITGIWFYDADDDMLKPAAVTDEGRELLGEPVSFERGESLAWDAFETGEIGRYDDVRTVEGAYNPETPIRSELDLPIGRHGVLTTATTRLAEFSEVDLDLLRILVSNTEAVLDRADHERDIERYREMVEAANDPIWAVDMEGFLTHVNQRIVDLSGHDRDTLVGSHMSLVFPESLVDSAFDHVRDLRERDEYSTTYQAEFRVSGGEAGTYQISLSLLSEAEERVGAVFVAHDVTELRRNEQLLSVFNRVLRHNLRNRMNIVLSHVDGLAEVDDDRVADPAESAATAARDLLALSEKTRRFQDVIVPDEAAVSVVTLSDQVDRVLAGIRTEYPEAVIRTAVPTDLLVRTNGTLPFAIEEIVRNAIQHTDAAPEVDISATGAVDDGTVELRVADNGPGIPDTERRALDRDLESPLEHTSGLGLWMVRWSTNTAGGSIEITDNDPRGTVVVLRLPVAEEAADRS